MPHYLTTNNSPTTLKRREELKQKFNLPNEPEPEPEPQRQPIHRYRKWWMCFICK